MHHFDYRGGVLHAEAVDLNVLAEAVGKTVTLRILRGGAPANLQVTVAERQGRE